MKKGMKLPLDVKMEAVEEVRLSRDFDGVAKKYDVNPITLRRWEKNYTPLMKPNMSMAKRDNLMMQEKYKQIEGEVFNAEVVRDLETRRKEFIERSFELKEQTLDLLSKRLPKEKNSRTLIESLKVLHSITGEYEDMNNDGTPSATITKVFLAIKEEYEKNKNNETATN